MSDIIKLLDNQMFKESLVDAINKAIDIPIIGEDVEGKIFKALLDVILEVAQKFS